MVKLRRISLFKKRVLSRQQAAGIPMSNVAVTAPRPNIPQHRF